MKMRIGETDTSRLRHSNPAAHYPEPECEAASPENRALVAIDPLSDLSQRPAGYRYAPFLAHLVATKDQHPQTRERRRAEPNDALAAYRATAALNA